MRTAWAASAVVWFGLSGVAARADLVTLADGGFVRGEVTEPAFGIAPDGPTVRVVTPEGIAVTLDADEVTGIVRRDPLLEELARRAAAAGTDAGSQWELAEFARVNRLDEGRERHLRAVLAADPGHRDARIALGYVLEGGVWMTRAEAMTARGLVEHDGRYVTPQEKELLKLSDAEREARRYWFGKVRLWSKWAASGDPVRAAEGADRLAAIDDPAAIPAVMNFLGESEAAAVRLAAIDVLAGIPGDAATGRLVAYSLRDGAKRVRDAARREITGSRFDAARRMFRGALTDNDNLVVRRAAMGLELVGGREAIPDLIAALVTDHVLAVEVPDQGEFGVGGTRLGTGNGGRLVPRSVEGAYLTGQLPDGFVVIDPFAPPVLRTRTVKVGRTFRNREVLEALVKISEDDSLGRRFGYDESAWTAWWHYASQM